MGVEERLVLILALIPHVSPSLLDFLYMKNTVYDIPFTEFGGVKHEKLKGYFPTGETAVFLLCGEDLKKRFSLLQLFSTKHFFHQDGILFLEKSTSNHPLLSGSLLLSQKYVWQLTTGKIL